MMTWRRFAVCLSFYFGIPLFRVAFLPPVTDNGALNNNGALRPRERESERERERERGGGGDFFLMISRRERVVIICRDPSARVFEVFLLE